MKENKNDLSKAIRHFWITRNQQSRNQGSLSGRRDAGERAAVTGGAQMNGFIELVKSLLLEAGIPDPSIFCKRGMELPGFYRPEK